MATTNAGTNPAPTSSTSKIGSKKLPPWAIAGIVGGGVLVAYYLYKKSKESKSSTAGVTTPESYVPTSGGGGFSGGGGYGISPGESQVIAGLQGEIKTQREAQEKALKEAKEGEAKEIKEAKEGYEKESGAQKGVITHLESLIQGLENEIHNLGQGGGGNGNGTPTAPPPVSTAPGTNTTPQGGTEPQPYHTPEGALVTGNPTGPVTVDYPERLAEVERELAKQQAPAPAPAPKTPACPPTFPLRSARGCYRPTRLRDGCECHEYQNGGQECQHKVGNSCVW